MNTKLGNVPFFRSVKYCDIWLICVGSIQNEFDVSPTTLDGCVGGAGDGDAVPPELERLGKRVRQVDELVSLLTKKCHG